jgi:hypothetical protein
MKMRIRYAVAAVAIPVVMSVAATPSFAGIFSSIEHEASKIEKGAVKEVGQVGKEVVKDIPKVGNEAGTIASKVFKLEGEVAGKIPVLNKAFKPLANDASKCAKSQEGKIGGMVGAGLAVATGGLSNVAIAAGAAAADGCIGTGAYNGGKKVVKEEVNDLRKSWRNP